LWEGTRKASKWDKKRTKRDEQSCPLRCHEHRHKHPASGQRAKPPSLLSLRPQAFDVGKRPGPGQEGALNSTRKCEKRAKNSISPGNGKTDGQVLETDRERLAKHHKEGAQKVVTKGTKCRERHSDGGGKSAPEYESNKLTGEVCDKTTRPGRVSERNPQKRRGERKILYKTFKL